MKPTEQQQRELRAYLDERFEPRWAEAIYKEMEGMEIDLPLFNPIVARSHGRHRWDVHWIFANIPNFPSHAIRSIRAHDPDFAAKVLMPPEVVWVGSEDGWGFKWADYLLYVDELGEWMLIYKGEKIDCDHVGDEDGRDKAEIAFLRHYMKSLI